MLKKYHNVTQIGPMPAWNPNNKAFTQKKQVPLWMRHHFEKKKGGKRKKRTRKKKRRKRKKSRRKKR